MNSCLSMLAAVSCISTSGDTSFIKSTCARSVRNSRSCSRNGYRETNHINTTTPILPRYIQAIVHASDRAHEQSRTRAVIGLHTSGHARERSCTRAVIYTIRAVTHAVIGLHMSGHTHASSHIYDWSYTHTEVITYT